MKKGLRYLVYLRPMYAVAGPLAMFSRIFNIIQKGEGVGVNDYMKEQLVTALFEIQSAGVDVFNLEEVVNALGRYGYFDEADWVYDNGDDFIKFVQQEMYGQR